jgi:Tfp pilus assembly protein PilO
MVPQPIESGSPFDTQKIQFTVIGLFDQVGEFLSDISSLLRIVVPYDVKIERATSPTMDSTGNTALLAVSFKIRTFIKTVAPVSGAEAAPPVPQPAPAPAPAAGAPPAQPPRAGGGGE